ncbi:hypothetical protein JCM19233_7244 [Vibrio astriarenae]|nr:hypothetical protein JCM19233_7244 [Vibrio sp. C7]
MLNQGSGVLWQTLTIDFILDEKEEKKEGKHSQDDFPL